MASDSAQLVTAEHEAIGRIHEAASDAAPVSGLTHGFYRYPARFSPTFARSAIAEFSKPGDLVADPFVGGGTSAVESMVTGRRFIGIDISELAVFVAGVKTSPIADSHLDDLEAAGIEWSRAIRLGRSEIAATRKYTRNMDRADSWRIRNAVDFALHSIPDLPLAQQEFLRCALLRAGQLALDGRKKVAPLETFRSATEATIGKMIQGMKELNKQLQAIDDFTAPVLRSGDAGHQTTWDQATGNAEKIKLVLTSPPYPGVHVLYHRWAIRGRRETPLPFAIAGRNDGAGLSHYTLGDRKAHASGSYYDRITSIYKEVRNACADDAWVVQMVGFSNPDSQLPRYLDAMSAAGFTHASRHDEFSEYWRDVPGRRWWAEYRENTRATSREVVLVHRPSS